MGSAKLGREKFLWLLPQYIQQAIPKEAYVVDTLRILHNRPECDTSEKWKVLLDTPV